MKTWIKDIAIVFVLVSIIEIALPSSKMKRYIDMIIGFLVIIVIISPFINLVNKDFQIDKEVFRNTIDQVQYEHKDNLELASVQENQVKEIYINKIKDEVKELILETTNYKVHRINISIYENKENYGEIKEMEIVLNENSEEDYDEEQTEDSAIVAVKIEEVKVGNDEEKSIKLRELENSNDIVDIICSNYNVSKKNIKVFLNTSEEGG